MHESAKNPIVKRLNRIEGQVRGVSAMIEDGRYCIDILTQVQAIKAALRKVEDELLKNHAAHCVEAAISDGDAGAQREKFNELVELFGRFRA
jgi:DNA-binding FrmR family transcriptional regulator